jgi:D-xylonolactonase
MGVPNNGPSSLELVADYECHTGENPLWHALEKRLYWTDIPTGRLFRYDPATGGHEQCYSGVPVGGFTVQADGALLLFMAAGAIAKWRDGRLDYVLEGLAGEQDGRFNDVVADPAGRVFCTAMPTRAHQGHLYRLDTDGSVHTVLDGLGIPNGMGFTPDRRQFYFTDSTQRRIFHLNYDDRTGALTNRRVWKQLPRNAGEPDGLTVDAQGYIWSARWDGSAVYRYTPAGAEVMRIEVPARKVSSVTFGGEDLSDLYLTTALAGGTRSVEGTGAGALFRLRLETGGVPEFFSRVRL